MKTKLQENEKQTQFLLYDDWQEVLYGGAAGGGKTVALLIAALQYVHQPDYNALILRRTFKQLEKPDAVIPLSKEWLMGTSARWNGEVYRWTFPSGATLTFGHMDGPNAKYDYQGAAYQFIGFDELTQFEEDQYTYLFSRKRRKAGSDIPTRFRSTTNPGGVGHDWVKKRFLSRECLTAGEDERFARVWPKDGRLFVPARLEDNKALDIADYEASLKELDPVTRAQLRKGDWKAHAGGRFNPVWWRRYQDIGDQWILLDSGDRIIKWQTPRVITLDPANRKTKASKYTAIGVFADAGRQRCLVLDITRRQLGIEEIVPTLHTVCRRWEPVDWAGIESNGFQIAITREARDKRRYPFIPTVIEMDPQGKSKLTRATPAIIRAEQGQMYLPEEAPWVEDYVSELAQFTGDEKEDGYTDQVDITAYAISGLDRFGVGGESEPIALEGGYRRR